MPRMHAHHNLLHDVVLGPGATVYRFDEPLTPDQRARTAAEYPTYLDRALGKDNPGNPHYDHCAPNPLFNSMTCYPAEKHREHGEKREEKHDEPAKSAPEIGGHIYAPLLPDFKLVSAGGLLSPHTYVYERVDGYQASADEAHQFARQSPYVPLADCTPVDGSAEIVCERPEG